MIKMNDIDVILSIPVSPVYINALVLFNGKLLPTFVNHTIVSILPFSTLDWKNTEKVKTFFFCMKVVIICTLY